MDLLRRCRWIWPKATMYVLSSTRFIVDSSSSVMISQKIFEKICTYLVNPKILGGPWPPWPPTNEATKSTGMLSAWNFPNKFFMKFSWQKKNKKFWGGHGPPGPPTNEATGTEQGQALPSSTEQGQALACFLHETCFLHEIFLTNFSWNFPDKKKK